MASSRNIVRHRRLPFLEGVLEALYYSEFFDANISASRREKPCLFAFLLRAESALEHGHASEAMAPGGKQWIVVSG